MYIFMHKNFQFMVLYIFHIPVHSYIDIRVRARALTALASAANSVGNMEVIAVVKELVLPRNVTSEDQPMEANGMHTYMYVVINFIYTVRMHL